MAGTSPFADIPPDKQNDYRYLLERVYLLLAADTKSLSDAVKGKIGEHNGRLDKLEGTVGGMEACPCSKRHDPTVECPLWILEKGVLRSKWQNKGIYAGVFLSGAVFYYVAQLVLQYLKFAG